MFENVTWVVFDTAQVAPVKVDESAADRQRLLAENAKLKVDSCANFG